MNNRRVFILGGGIAALIAAGILIGAFVFRGSTTVAAIPPAPVGTMLTQTDIQKILNDRLATTDKNVADLTTTVGGIQTTVAGLDKSMNDAKALFADFKTRFDALKASNDATKTSADNASTAAAAAQTSADAAKAAIDKANANVSSLRESFEILARSNIELTKQVDGLDQRLAKIEAKSVAGPTASTAAPADTATKNTLPTSFNWPAKAEDRYTMAAARCGDDEWVTKGLDRATVQKLLGAWSADDANYYLGEGTDCDAFMKKATTFAKIMKDLTPSEPGPQVQAQVTVTAPAAPVAPGPVVAQARPQVQPGMAYDYSQVRKIYVPRRYH